MGEWRNDKKNGKGILKLYNGHVFQGSWDDDQFVGGTVTFSNGDRYDGELLNQNRHGFGTYNYKNNNTEYRGRWENGERNGVGIIFVI